MILESHRCILFHYLIYYYLQVILNKYLAIFPIRKLPLKVPFFVYFEQKEFIEYHLVLLL